MVILGVHDIWNEIQRHWIICVSAFKYGANNQVTMQSQVAIEISVLKVEVRPQEDLSEKCAQCDHIEAGSNLSLLQTDTKPKKTWNVLNPIKRMQYVGSGLEIRIPVHYLISPV